MVIVTGWRYWFRRCFGWFPIQPCIGCHKLYWGGFPTIEGWQACYREYCSQRCHDDSEYWWD
jgi:hypothetical protein